MDEFRAMRDDAPPIPAHVARSISAVLLVLATVVVLGFLLKIFAFEGVRALLLLMVPVVIALWVLGARDRWWTLLPIAYSLGGVFYFGFKIYTHEIALLLIMLALMPMLLLRSQRIARAPPAASYGLLAFFGMHMVVSVYRAIAEGQGGVGGVVRVYMHGMWPLVFLILLVRYGDTRHLKMVFVAMYAVCIVRVVLGFVGVLSPQLLYIPVVNYILPGVYTGGTDLRASALLLISLSLCGLSLAKSVLGRAAHGSMAALAGVMVLLGGSRVSLGVFCAVLLLWSFFRRQHLVLGVVLLALSLAVMALNRSPHLVYRLSPHAQRTVSVLIVQSRTHDLHRGLESSNDWHFLLMRLGLERWLDTPISFLLGNRVRAYDEDRYASAFASLEERARVAGGVGSYESGLWTVLAVIGLCGAMLYAAVFWKLLRQPVRALMRDGICDIPHAYYFLASAGIVVWVCFCWIAGHFPSQELMLSGIAAAAWHDQRRAEPGVGEGGTAPGRSALRGLEGGGS